MENFEKVAIAIVIFIITSVVAYLFRMRQLYVAVPKLYKESRISKDGSLCEIDIYNKGNQVEEDISISLDQSLRIELLAASAADVTFSDSVIKINRLHKNSEISVLLLVENGILTHDKINLAASKGAKAKILKRPEDIPSNYAHTLVALALLVGLVPAVSYSFDAYRYYEKYKIESELKSLYKIGWSGLERYYNSSIKQSYSNQEFPIRYISQKLEKNGDAILIFEGNNKTATPLSIYIFDHTNDPLEKRKLIDSLEINPIESKKFIVTLSKKYRKSDNFILDFSLSIGEDHVSRISLKSKNENIIEK